jgi:hypothetical protein
LVFFLIKSGDDELSKKLEEASKEAVAYYRLIAGTTVVNGSGWVYDKNLAEFINEIDNVSTIKRKDALERLAKSIETTMNNQLAEPIAFLMNELSTELKNFWKRF